MLGKLWSDTVSRVKLTAVEVQHQVTERAAKAREALSIYRWCITADQLEHTLLVQATEVKTYAGLKEICGRWIHELNESKQTKSPRYSNDKEYKHNKRRHSKVPNKGVVNTDSNSKGRESNSSVNNKTEGAIEVKGASSSHVSQTVASVPSDEEAKDPLSSDTAELLDDESKMDIDISIVDSASFSNTAKANASSSISESTSAPTRNANDHSVVHTISEISDAYSQIGLTFRQVFLRSRALEKLILTVFKNADLVKEFVGPLDQNEKNPVRDGLLKLFSECLTCGEKVHREIISLLMTMDPRWKNHVEWVTILVTTIKYDHEEDRLNDIRRLMVVDATQLRNHLSDRGAGSHKSRYNEPLAADTENALVTLNIRIIASRKLIQLYQLIEANMIETAERRRFQLRTTTRKLKSLMEKMTEKEKLYTEKAIAALRSQELLEDETKKMATDSQTSLAGKRSEFHSYDEELIQLENKRVELTAALEEVVQRIDYLETIKTNHHQELEVLKRRQTETQQTIEDKVAEELRCQLANEQLRDDSRSIGSIAAETKEELFKDIPLRAKRIADDAVKIKCSTIALLNQHFIYEKERMLHQNEVITNYCSLLSQLIVSEEELEAVNVGESSWKSANFREMSNKGNTANNLESEYHNALLLSLDQLDAMWAEIHSFAFCCGNLLKTQTDELISKQVENFSLEGIATETRWESNDEGGAATSSTHSSSGLRASDLDGVDFKELLDNLETLYFNIRNYASHWIKRRSTVTEGQEELTIPKKPISKYEAKPAIDSHYNMSFPNEPSDFFDDVIEADLAAAEKFIEDSLEEDAAGALHSFR